MIAEDEPLTRELLCALIREALDEQVSLIIPVANGLEAMEKLEQFPVDILLTDISMPEMDGIELIKAVDRNYPNTVKIIISGYDEFDYAKQSLKYHAQDYLLKPVESQELIAAITKGISATKQGLENSHKLGLINMHFSGKLSFLYTTNSIKDIIVGIKTKNEDKVRDVTGELVECIFREGDSLAEQKEMSHWIVSTFFICFPEMRRDDNEPACIARIKAASSPQEISHILHELFVRCMDQVSEMNSSQAKLRQIKSYIAANYSEDISLQSLSDYFGLTNAYICSLFSQYSDQNFKDYLQEVRINQAVTLLEQSNLKIYEIARATGYNDANYFARAFRKLIGMTPNEFRTKMRGD